MLSAAVWLMLSSMLTSLRISGGGSFPKPLTAEEERMYLQRSAAGDLKPATFSSNATSASSRTS